MSPAHHTAYLFVPDAIWQESMQPEEPDGFARHDVARVRSAHSQDMQYGVRKELGRKTGGGDARNYAFRRIQQPAVWSIAIGFQPGNRSLPAGIPDVSAAGIRLDHYNAHPKVRKLDAPG